MKVTDRHDVDLNDAHASPVTIDPRAEQRWFRQRLDVLLSDGHTPQELSHRLQGAFGGPTSSGTSLSALSQGDAAALLNARSSALNDAAVAAEESGAPLPAEVNELIAAIDSVAHPSKPAGVEVDSDDYEPGATAADIRAMKDVMAGKDHV